MGDISLSFIVFNAFGAWVAFVLQRFSKIKLFIKLPIESKQKICSLCNKSQNEYLLQMPNKMKGFEHYYK